MIIKYLNRILKKNLKAILDNQIIKLMIYHNLIQINNLVFNIILIIFL